jgi:hypothetical protein
LFAASILVANLSSISSSATSFDWDHTPVVSGCSVTVRVTAAPCHPVTVTLYVDGREISGQIGEVPGQITLAVPEGIDGQGYTIEIKCPDQRDSESGFII